MIILLSPYYGPAQFSMFWRIAAGLFGNSCHVLWIIKWKKFNNGGEKVPERSSNKLILP
jgi:hypothetical protein